MPSHQWFGHQDDLAYGVEWSAERGGSDVKEVAGDYPAVYGWEASGIENAALPHRRARMHTSSRRTRARGAPRTSSAFTATR